MKSSLLYYFVNFLFLFFINPFSAYSYDSLSFHESEPGFKISQILSFWDHTSVIILSKPINDTCTEPRIDLRILNPDGSIDVAKVDFPVPIPEFNFCRGPSHEFFVYTIERSFPKSLYILYINSTDIESASYYVLLATRTGEIISNTYVAPASIINGTIHGDGYILSHFLEGCGFIYSNYISETEVFWSFFSSPDDEGNISQVNSGNFYIQKPLDSYYVFPGIEGTFVFITVNSTNSTSNDNFINPSEFTSKVYTFLVKPIMNGLNGPFLIYQSAIPDLEVNFICDGAYVGTGNVCLLQFDKTTYLKVSFHNSGAVSGIEKFTSIKTDDNVATVHINFLFTGGFLVTLSRKTEDKYFYTIEGKLYDNDGEYYSDLDIPKNLKVSTNSALYGFRNGTFLLVTQDDESNWSVLSTLVPKFISDHGYGNPNIDFTYPSIDSNNPLSITNINITYKFPVAVSTNNISIYQYSNDENVSILRQSIPGNSQFFSYSPDNFTINIKVLESTFNQPNSTYYIVISDNAIKDRKSNQPLMGNEETSWKFNSVNHENIFAEDAVVKFSLTTEGTTHFENLSSYEQTAFLSQLKTDLAKSIPVDINRLDDIKCCQYDNTEQSPKILLSLLIKSTINLNKRNVDFIIKDLNILIKNKETTPISWFGTTNLLDPDFGFQRTRNLWKDLKFHLIILTIGIIILGLLYLYAKKRYNGGDNTVIFKLPLAILDVILNIMFVLNDGKKVLQLYIPSIIFCIGPISINFIIGIIIILQEIKQNNYFYEWFKYNTYLTALFTVLASANIEVLNMLSSQVAGIMLFNAPISIQTNSYIFWVSIFGFIIKDIPRFIIQVLYKKYIIVYDIIPFLTLSISSIVLSINIVLKIYHIIIKLKKLQKRISLQIDQYSQYLDFKKNSNNITVPKTAKMYHRKSV